MYIFMYTCVRICWYLPNGRGGRGDRPQPRLSLDLATAAVMNNIDISGTTATVRVRALRGYTSAASRLGVRWHRTCTRLAVHTPDKRGRTMSSSAKQASIWDSS